MYKSAAERAEQINASVELIYGAIKSGDLLASNVGGPQRPTYRISDEDWEAFLEARKSRPAPGMPRRPRRQKLSGVTEFFPLVAVVTAATIGSLTPFV